MSPETDIYTAYYMRQAGSGYSNIYSAPAFQRGMGVGKFESNLNFLTKKNDFIPNICIYFLQAHF